MNTDTGRLTGLLQNLEARLSLDVAARSLSRGFRRMIIFTVLTTLVTVALVAHNGYASHRWRAKEDATVEAQTDTMQQVETTLNRLLRAQRRDDGRHRELPIGSRGLR